MKGGLLAKVSVAHVSGLRSSCVPICALFSVLALPAATTTPQPPDAAAFDRILKQYVLDNGTVRYGELKANFELLTQLVQQIAEVSPDSHPALFPTRAHKLSYWLNTYNALV